MPKRRDQRVIDKIKPVLQHFENSDHDLVIVCGPMSTGAGLPYELQGEIFDALESYVEGEDVQ